MNPLLLTLCMLFFTPFQDDCVRRVYSMGTMITVEISAHSRSVALTASQEAITSLERSEQRLSTWSDASELAHFNNGPVNRWVDLSEELYRDLIEGRGWWQATEGAFHPGLGSLIDLWDLRGRGRVPPENEIHAVLEASNIGNLQLAAGRGRRSSAGFRIEEGGFAKGIALRDAGAAALTSGATCASFDFGGQIYRTGTCSPIRVGLAHPRTRHTTIGEIEFRTGSLATSGLSERHIEVDGQIFGHILDPHTGRPITTEMTATVYADDPVAADCLATAFLIMGTEASLAWLDAHPGIGVIFTRTQGEIIDLIVSTNLEQQLAIHDSSTRMIVQKNKGARICSSN